MKFVCTWVLAKRWRQSSKVAMGVCVSAFSEFLEVWLKRRPRMLLESVTQLVGSPEAASRIYKHPLISSLARKGSHPSYIPAKTFALAVLDSLGVLGEGGMASVLPDLSKVDGEFGDSLRVLAHDAGGDLEKFKQGIEQWFDNAMDRVTGWYKRQTQWILLIVAVVLTVWANADTLKIAKELWTNPGVRAAFVAQAQQSVAQYRALISPPRKHLKHLELNIYL